MNVRQEANPSPRPPERAGLWAKAYRDPESAARAVANYQWLTSLAPPLRLPALKSVVDRTLWFERLDWAHTGLGDLVHVAGHLGDVHATAHQLQLCRAHLGQDVTGNLPGGQRHRIPGFLTGRIDTATRLLNAGAVPQPLLDARTACALMTATADRPASFYKDSNPRNLLIATGSDGGLTAPATIDFDDLTLAPFGYDLAKLVVGLAMTCGRIPDDLVAGALDAYNVAVRRRAPDLPDVTMGEFIVWAEIHHVLTCRYIGRNGYRYGWHELRPATLLPLAGELLTGATQPPLPVTSSR